MDTIQDFFKVGMSRMLPPLWQPPPGPTLELGPGIKPKVATTYKLGLPGWHAELDPLPYPKESISAVHAYHFFEHIEGKYAIQLLREIQRVLVPHGTAYIVVPYYSTSMQHQDLTHKSWWTETTWKTLFDNEYYDDHSVGWDLHVHLCFIMGIVERNLALFTQLIKEV
jgi:hypothetical protein